MPCQVPHLEGGVGGSEVFYSEAQLLQGSDEEEVQSASAVNEYFPEEHFLDGGVEDEGETPCIRDVRPLVGPTEGGGDLRPGAITGVGDGVFCVDGDHPAGGELLISSALGGGEAPEDSGDHHVVILEGVVVVVPRWSATSGSIIVVVVFLFVLEFLSQAKAVLHLVLAVLVEGHGPSRIFLYC